MQYQPNGVEVARAEEQVVPYRRIVARVVAAEHLAGEGQPVTADGYLDVEAGLLEPALELLEQMEVLYGAHEAEPRSSKGGYSPDRIEETLLGSLLINIDLLADRLQSRLSDYAVTLEQRQDNCQLWVAVIGDGDEVRRHARVDVHLAVAHVRDQFYTHHLHLVVDEVARSVARVGC